MRWLRLFPILCCAAGAWAQQTCDTTSYPLSSPSTRFETDEDGTATDRESKLMWMRCSAGQQWQGHRCVGALRGASWAGAQAFAWQVNEDGRHFFKDWRLPTLPELASIAERQCSNPRVNLAVFPDSPPAAFWTVSARPGQDYEAYAYALSFGAEGVRLRHKEQESYVRLVRNAE